VGVSLKDINIEASLEPHDSKKSPTSKFLDANSMSTAEKRNVTPGNTRPSSSELMKDVEESKAVGTHL